MPESIILEQQIQETQIPQEILTLIIKAEIQITEMELILELRKKYSEDL